VSNPETSHPDDPPEAERRELPVTDDYQRSGIQVISIQWKAKKELVISDRYLRFGALNNRQPPQTH
jgi:hypothetical protein